MAVVCTINAVTRSIRGMVIEDILTREPNTASFALDESNANKPIEGQEVIITLDGTKIFAGRVTFVKEVKLDGTTWRFEVECIDYQIDLEHHLVVETYTSETVYDIIDDINTDYCSGFTITNVENPGPTIDQIQFNYLSVGECLTKLADLIGYDWYVDYNKDIHFFPVETNLAPIALEDNGEEFDDLHIETDRTQIRNRIFVRGGWYLSANYTQDTITAGAGQKEFPVRYRPHSLTVTVDAAGKTVGIENEDLPGGHDFLLNPEEKLLKVDNIVMAGAEAVIMIYKYEVPVNVRVDDTPSQIALAAIDGTDGIIEHRLLDENINNDEWARDVGKQELRQWSNALVTGSFITLYPGFKSGQRLHIDLTDRNIDAYYLIRQVTIEALGGDSLRYTVKFATLLLGFTWLIIKLLDKSREIQVREGEILDQLVVIPEEATATDSTPTTEQSTPNFQYGPGGSPQGVYNESQYG